MSFINKFLDLTETLPRQIIRLLKLLKVVEEKSNDIKIILETKRAQYLENLKGKNAKKNTTLKNLKLLNRELLSLSDYKLEVIKEIKYLLEASFLNKLSPIIEEGKEEVNEQIFSNGANKINIPISYNDNMLLDEDQKTSENKTVDTEREVPRGYSNNINQKFLSKKKQRTKNLKKIKSENISENSKKLVEDINMEVYCKCKKQSYGKMIQCDNPDCGEWFHYECMGINEREEPEEWYCSEKCKENAKKMRKKIPKLK